MEPCLQINQLHTDLCCWGRRPVVPIELYTFCSIHATSFIEYVLISFFKHAAKKALFLSTNDAFYVVIPVTVQEYQVLAWKAKSLPNTPTHMKPLHFRKKTSGLMMLGSVVELFHSLPRFQLSCIIQTSLEAVDALRYVVVPLWTFRVERLQFDAAVPAFVTPPDGFILPDVLSAPFVMLINGSTTPDPRLYSSGTQSLWNTLTGSKAAPLSAMRYGVLLQQTKTLPLENRSLEHDAHRRHEHDEYAKDE